MNKTPLSDRGCIALKEYGGLTFELAADEWVPLVLGRASADGVVGDDVAEGVGAADAHAGVLALAADAGAVLGALAVGDTLRPAVGRVVDEARLARADAGAGHHTLATVGTALLVAARIGL